MMDRLRKIYNGNKDFFAIVVIVVFVSFILWITDVGCLIKFFTGISCAGCGMTRAWVSVLHLDIREAFYYHPLFPLPAAAVVVFFFKSKINPKVYNLLIAIAVIAFIAVYIYRIADPDNNIIVFEPEKGLLYKIFFYKRR